MANHKQALKRHRQSLVRRERNRSYNRRMKSYVKKALAALEDGDEKTREAAMQQAISEVAKVASRGVIPKKRAARKISRLMKALNRTR